MKDLTFPEYIPPRELQQLYFDFVTDKSVSWVNVAPKDWWQYEVYMLTNINTSARFFAVHEFSLTKTAISSSAWNL